MKPRETVSYHRKENLPGIESCRVLNSSHRFPNHFHDDLYGIGLMECGASYPFGPGKNDTTVGAGEVTLINPGQVHSGVPVDGTRVTYTMCYVDTAAMGEIALALDPCDDGLPEFTRPVTTDKRLFLLFQSLFHHMSHPGESLAEGSALVEAFGYLLSRYSRLSKNRFPGACGRHPVKMARELLASDLDRKLTLAEVAGEVGLSQYHFLRVFKKETGLPPHLYRTLKRVEAAKVFLRQGCPPAEVALDTGFSDQSHFTNTFHRYFGVTPCQYLIKG